MTIGLHRSFAARRQRGFLMVMAVFLLVVIAGLAVYLGTVSTTSQASSAADLNAAKAYQAARAGAEWAAYWISPPAKVSAFKMACDAGPSPPANLTIQGFTVTVKCTHATVTEGAASVEWYLIESKACNAVTCPAGTPPGSTYVERELSLTLTATPP